MEAGKHQTVVPIDKVIGRELEIIGSHGMQAHRYREMFEMIGDGLLDPKRLIGKTITLDDAPDVLVSMNKHQGLGVTVIEV